MFLDQRTLDRLDYILSAVPPNRVDETRDMVILVYELRVRRQELVDAITERLRKGVIEEELDTFDLSGASDVVGRRFERAFQSRLEHPEETAYIDAMFDRIRRELNRETGRKGPTPKPGVGKRIHELRREIAEREEQLARRLGECESWFPDRATMRGEDA